MCYLSERNGVYSKKSKKAKGNIVTKGKLYTASDTEDIAENNTDQNEATRTRKAKRMARQRVKQGSVFPGTEGSKDRSIGISGDRAD